MQTTYLVGCSGTQEIVDHVKNILNLPGTVIESGKFPNEELKIRVPECGETTILIGSLSSPVNSRIVEYLLTADALKRMGCRHIIGVLTWYAYSKQDKVFLPGEPLSAKVIASLIQTVSIRELLCFDLHNPSISGYFEIPVMNLSASKIFINEFKSHDLSNAIVVSPDAGSIKNSTKVAQELNIPIAYAAKQRDLMTGEVTVSDLNTDINGKNVVIFDDMIATGSTLVEVSEFLKERGANKITICCTHHLYIPGVQNKLDAAPIDDLYVTNSITKPAELSSDKLHILDISPLLCQSLEPIISRPV